MTEGIEQPIQEKIRTLEEIETFEYLGKLVADTIKQVEMKEKKNTVSEDNEKTAQNQTM